LLGAVSEDLTLLVVVTTLLSALIGIPREIGREVKELLKQTYKQ